MITGWLFVLALILTGHLVWGLALTLALLVYERWYKH